MHLGFTIFPTDDSIAPAELARAAEERGFESLWLAEHSHIPASRETPWPGGAELPQDVLRRDASRSSRSRGGRGDDALKLATGICLVVAARPDPDREAGGDARPLLERALPVRRGRRLERRGDGRTTARDLEARFAVMRERIEAMKEIWTESAPSTTASTSTSGRLSPGRSPCRSRTRRSTSAARSRAARRARRATATAGCRSHGRGDDIAAKLAGVPGAGRATRGATPPRSRSRSSGRGRGARLASATATPARRAACSGFRPAERDAMLPLLDRCGAGDRLTGRRSISSGWRAFSDRETHSRSRRRMIGRDARARGERSFRQRPPRGAHSERLEVARAAEPGPEGDAERATRSSR